jgi:hypothetical protein
MSTNDFEKRLQQQPLRPIPSHWRDEILGAASGECAARANLGDRKLSSVLILLWRELIHPCPVAWSGMVGLWLMLWAVNAHLRSGDEPELNSGQTASESQRIQSFKEARGVLVELTGPLEEPGDNPARHTRPKPHTQLATPTRNC